MTRPTLTIACVRTSLRVDVDGQRVGTVHRDVTHHAEDGRKVTRIRFVGISDCRCDAARSVFYGATSDESAADMVVEHLRIVHAVGATRGVA